MTNTQTQEGNEILIPRKIVVTHLQGKEFYDSRKDRALKSLIDQGYQPVFMPQLIDARIESDKDSRVWQTGFTTPSIRATGIPQRGKYAGKPVVAYFHADNHISNPDNITEAIDGKEGLVNYAGRIPQEEFQRFVDLDGQTDQYGNQVSFLVPYDDLRGSKSGVIPVKHALSHPQVIPFLGGEERAKKYLQRHKEVFGDEIGVWHLDDLDKEGNEPLPLGRLLYLGDGYINGLDGDDDLNGNGQFVGVRDGAQKISRPSLEQMLKYSERFVPEVARTDFKKGLEGLYK